MRHRVKGRHLARTAAHRRALYRNLIAALFEHGRIRTTDAKAREIRPLAEKMITLGKRGDLHARRLVMREIGTGAALERLFGAIAQRFADRPGGYTRMVKAGRRHGDAAPLAYLELLDEAPRVVRAPAGEEETAETKAEARGAGAAAAGRRAAPKAKTSKAAPRGAAPGTSSKGRAKASEEAGPKPAKGGKGKPGASAPRAPSKGRAAKKKSGD
jgi:large subunit ribosomal protein L17